MSVQGRLDTVLTGQGPGADDRILHTHAAAILPPAPAPSLLEVVSDPHGELRLAEPVAARGRAVLDRVIREVVILPLLVEQCPPRPVEVDREPKRERFEPDTV